MADPIHVLTDRLAPAFAAVRDAAGAGDDVDASPNVRPSDRADFQANGALALAKRIGRPPRDVAAEVVDAADLADLCHAVDIAGPGFINLDLTDVAIADLLRPAVADARLDVAPDAVPIRVVIDYSAPNVAKEMHVGHLRTTIIGDALVRILGFLGHDIVRQNHIGDWGTPFGMLIEHLIDIGEEETVAELEVGSLNAFYQDARATFDADESFQQRSRARVVALQSGDEATLRLWRVLVGASTTYFDRVYEALGVMLTDDDIRGESSYNDDLDAVVRDLDELGLIVTDDGAECVFPPGFTGRDGSPQPMIVRKRDGGYGYSATDLATIRHRVDDLAARRILYVVGAPQRDHLKMLFAVARMAGWLPDSVSAEHVAFGSILDTDRRIFRTRSGQSIRLVDLLDEAVERAAAAIAERNPDLPDDEAAAVARAVGIGAAKFADLSNDRVKDYLFDFDRMLAFEGETGPYLQYAHARIQSIFRRGEVDTTQLAGASLVVAEPAEHRLALALLGFGAAVRAASEGAQPHRLATYLSTLASTFTAFYDACPVLRTDDAARTSRLVLCDLTARTLAIGLRLLGIEAPDRM